MVSFEELLDSSLSVEKKKVEEELKKALFEANSIVDEYYKNIISEYAVKIQDLIQKSNERINSEIAKNEIDNKRILNREKDYWIEQVKAKAFSELTELTNTDEYKKGLRAIISREAKDGCIIYCSPSEKGLIQSILKEFKIKGNVEVDNTIKAGIKIFYPDQSLLRDFTLETVLSQVFDDIRDEIAKILFGE
ncbi:V-type ATP synthase subunit E [Sulfolobaceae archaeon RB850M]